MLVHVVKDTGTNFIKYQMKLVQKPEKFYAIYLIKFSHTLNMMLHMNILGWTLKCKYDFACNVNK